MGSESSKEIIQNQIWEMISEIFVPKSEMGVSDVFKMNSEGHHQGEGYSKCALSADKL